MNLSQDWGEFSKLADLPMLQELTFNGNPLEVTMQADGDYLDKGPVYNLSTQRFLLVFRFKHLLTTCKVKDKIKSLKKLDSTPIVREEDDEE